MFDPKTLACYTGRLLRRRQSVAYVRTRRVARVLNGIGGPFGCPVCGSFYGHGPNPCGATGPEAGRC